MALTLVNVVNLPVGTTLKVGSITKTADAAGAIMIELAQGQYTAELGYGGQIYNITLNVGKSTADLIQEATTAATAGLFTQVQVNAQIATATAGLKTQAEFDAALVTATAGLKTQAELDAAVALATANTVPQADLDTVNAQLAQETANAVEIGKGYIDATALDIVETANQFGAKSYTISVKYSIDKVKTPLVAKVRETFSTGDTQDILIADALDNREVMVYRNDGTNTPTITKIEVIAGNNKVIDTYDLAFTETITMLPDPVATVTPSMEEVTLATTNTVQVKTRNVPDGTLYLYDVNKSTYVASDPIVGNTVTFNGTFVAGAKHFISDKNTAQLASQDYIGKFTIPAVKLVPRVLLHIENSAVPQFVFRDVPASSTINLDGARQNGNTTRLTTTTVTTPELVEEASFDLVGLDGLVPNNTYQVSYNNNVIFEFKAN